MPSKEQYADALAGTTGILEAFQKMSQKSEDVDEETVSEIIQYYNDKLDEQGIGHLKVS